MTNAKNATYQVGYARPPLQSRFKKGQSGNPTGRRRRATDTVRGNDLLRQEADRLVTVREGDKVVRMPAARAAVRRLFHAAVQGDWSALKMVLAVLQDIAADEAKRKPVDELSPREIARRLAFILARGELEQESDNGHVSDPDGTPSTGDDGAA
jgi:hypothetical protein